MISKQLKTTTGENIWVFDDVFSFQEMLRFNQVFEKSLYSLGGSSYNTIVPQDTFFISLYDAQDLQNLEIFYGKNINKIMSDHLNDLSIVKQWVLATTHLSSYNFHSDALGYNRISRTLLYYGNTKWDRDWGGETLFCDNNGDTEIAVSVKPGRLVIFDSCIPHRPAALSLHATPYRFTFIAQFAKLKDKNESQ